jgi:general L-amino acid transport system substrate-binding protein
MAPVGDSREAAMKALLAAIMMAGLGLASGPGFGLAPAHAATLEDVLARGRLVCGVSDGLAGFSDRDAGGAWAGFDVDFCRALATAIFADPAKVDYVPLSAADRFEAVRNGRIDLLSRNSTWTLSRDRDGLEFAGVAYHDGQGFLVRAGEGVSSALQMQDARICVLGDTTTETNAAAFFASRGVAVTFQRFQTRAEARAAYAGERCDAYTADRSALAAERSLMSDPEEHVFLRETISKEPLGPVTREGDQAWTDLVRWTLFGLINAEEAGISQDGLAGTDEKAGKQKDAAVAMGEAAAKAFRLDPGWLVAVVAKVGNYGDVFDRNLGRDSPLGIERGMNALWSAGGILYAPPMQ